MFSVQNPQNPKKKKANYRLANRFDQFTSR